MNKKTLVNKIAARSNLKKNDCEKIFDRVMDLIYDEIKKEKSCEIENFGNFRIEHRKQSSDIDIKSGEEILLPPKDKMKFYPSQILLQKLNSIEEKNN